MSAELTKEDAIRIHDEGLYSRLSMREAALLQLATPKLFMPFGEFQRVTEHLLGRDVWTHEFANPTALLREVFGLTRGQNPIESLERVIGGEEATQ